MSLSSSIKNRSLSEKGVIHDLDDLSMFRPHSLTEEYEIRQKLQEQGVKQEDANEEELRKTFLHLQMKPLFYFFRFSGCFPFQLTSSGVEFKLYSVTFLYALFCYASLALMILVVVYDVALQEGKTEKRLSMFNQLFIPMMASYLLVPLSSWQDSSAAAAYFNKWRDFQVMYLKTTQTNANLKIKKIVRIFAVCIPSVTIGSIIVSLKALNTQFVLSTSIVIVFNSLCFWSFTCLWIIPCLALSAIGESIAQRFKVDVTNNNNRTPRVIDSYRTLWLQLSSLAGYTGYALYRMSIMSALVMSWFITISLYALPLSFKQKDYTSFMIYCDSALSCVGITYIIYSLGYTVPIKIKKPIQAELQTLNTTNLSSEAWLQMMEFLRATHSNAPVLSMGGFVNIDRKLLQAAIATIGTYLIVMLQFRGSQDARTVNNEEFASETD